jgi:ABC-type phosphate transport system substrate-binding protein
MRHAVLAVAVAVLLGAVSAPAATDEVAVIVNKSNPVSTLSMVQLRKIMLAQEVKWPTGSRIVVWMTPPGQRERAAMLKIVCGMSETDFTLHFMHASFNGETADLPRTAGSGALVRRLVAGAVNGLALILASQADDTVKVLTIEGNSPGEAAYRLIVK